MDRSLIRTSKFLSLVLRHQPEVIGLTLDENGWVSIDELLEAAGRSGREISREVLFQVVAENDKQRFALSDDQTRIRANQGHSVSVDLDLAPARPPELLYHGTVERFLSSIQEQGLQPGSRRHVHLSRDAATARIVGSRRGAPVILTIDASGMHADGQTFYLSANGV